MRKFLFLLVDQGDENVGIYSRLLGLQYGTVSSRSVANPGNCTVRADVHFKLQGLTNCVLFNVHCTLTSRYTIT